MIIRNQVTKTLKASPLNSRWSERRVGELARECDLRNTRVSVISTL